MTLGPLLRTVAGVTGKQATDVEVISPLLLPEAKDHGVAQLLAGEVPAYFGGFLDLDARVSDVDLGWDPTGKQSHQVPTDIEQQGEAPEPQWTDGDCARGVGPEWRRDRAAATPCRVVRPGVTARGGGPHPATE